jgi:hypothetical protein
MITQFSKHIKALPKRNKKDVVGEGTGMRAVKATDIEYIENRSYKGKGKGWSLDWLWGGGIIFFFIITRPYRGGTGLYYFLGISTVFIFGFLYHYIAPKKYFIASRQTGKLKVPISNKKPEVWVNFSEGFAYEKTAYLDDFYTSLFFQTKPEVKPGAVFSLADFEREDYWNFFVWYMDKNRPLPPGSAFDSYREQDFERRKAAGFPKPLYPSDISTPEATAEQQKEREKIGGW